MAPQAGATFVDVAVNSGQPARQAFTYAVPEGMDVRAGQAVFVPFGARIVQGVVLRMSGETTLEAVRPVAAVADPEAVLDSAHIALAEWMSEEYLAPLWDCVACCLPAGYGQRPVTMVSPVEIPPLLPVYPKGQAVSNTSPRTAAHRSRPSAMPSVQFRCRRCCACRLQAT